MSGSAAPAITVVAKESSERTSSIRVLVVDDSVVMRQLITRMLNDQPGVEVIGFARNGREAVSKVVQSKPDLVTLDVEMPEMDGVSALRLIKEQVPSTRVIMCSSLTSRGASVTIESLMLGADDYVFKQRSGERASGAFEAVRDDLLGKISQLFPTSVAASARHRPAAQAAPTLTPGVGLTRPIAQAGARPKPKVVAIGVSTGGPSALAEFLPMFPATFPLPILIVQHMPPLFTASLAERLTRLGQVPVVEAKAGMVLEPGKALLAPGDFHMRLAKRGLEVETTLDQGERECSCRPSVDVLFRSVEAIFGGAVIATILTGMGQDGLEGVRGLRSQGATVIAQDKASSVVWGMPGAVVGASLADHVLPLKQIYTMIARQIQ